MFRNCLDEIQQCCDAGNRGAAKVAEVWDCCARMNSLAENKVVAGSNAEYNVSITAQPESP